MPSVIVILAVLGLTAWWLWRSSQSGGGARGGHDLSDDVAASIIAAPRRIAFRPTDGRHPVEGIRDARLAMVGIGQAFLDLGDRPSDGEQDRLALAIRTALRADAEEARELEVIGRWLIGQCGGAQSAITRLGRRLYQLEGDEGWDALEGLLSDITTGDLSAAQLDAIEDLRIAFKRDVTRV